MKMKKIAVLLILAITTLWLSSCTRHNNPTFNESDIVSRKWSVQSSQQLFG